MTRTWEAARHPDWLVFEAEGRLQIRPRQHTVARHLIDSIEASEAAAREGSAAEASQELVAAVAAAMELEMDGDEGGNGQQEEDGLDGRKPGAICQLNMGEGKTRVILPMLALYLARPGGTRVVRTWAEDLCDRCVMMPLVACFFACPFGSGLGRQFAEHLLLELPTSMLTPAPHPYCFFAYTLPLCPETSAPHACNQLAAPLSDSSGPSLIRHAARTVSLFSCRCASTSWGGCWMRPTHTCTNTSVPGVIHDSFLPSVYSCSDY